MLTEDKIRKFINESNAIEGIYREATASELEEFRRFMALDEITVADMERFVSVYQRGAKLRDRKGMNVQVGNHIPPSGDITVRTRLMDCLTNANVKKRLGEGERHAFKIHCVYEALHPFMDGNGRAGRMLWAWMMGERALALPFLHMFYYQSLQYWQGGYNG